MTPGRNFPDVRNFTFDDLDSGVRDEGRVRRGYRFRVPVDSEQPSCGIQLLDDLSAVATPAERPVHVTTARLDVEPEEHRLEQDRYMTVSTPVVRAHSTGIYSVRIL